MLTRMTKIFKAKKVYSTPLKCLQIVFVYKRRNYNNSDTR